MMSPHTVTDFFTNFTTDKRVVIKSRLLRIPEVCLMVFIFVFVLIYQVIYNLEFMCAASVDGDAVLSLRMPEADFWSLNDPDINSTDLIIPALNYSYCRPSHISNINTVAQLHISGCRNFDNRELVRSTVTDKDTFIPSRIVQVKQTRCSLGSACKRLWRSEVVSDVFVAGVEDFHLKIRHSVRSAALQQDTIVSGANTQGFIEASNGTLWKIPCYGSLCQKYKRVSGFGRISLGQLFGQQVNCPFCGSDAQLREGCFSKADAYDNGDYISVEKLIQYAGIDLDEHLDEIAFTSRISGVSISLDIVYDNMDPVDYWTWPPGPKPKYTYRIRHEPFSSRDHISFSSLSRETSTTRSLEKAYGILIHVTLVGQLGSFSKVRAVVSILSVAGLVWVSHWFVSRVLIEIYKCIPSFRHVQSMHALYERDESPFDEDFRGSLRERRGSALIRLGERVMKQRAEAVVGGVSEDSDDDNDERDYLFSCGRLT